LQNGYRVFSGAKSGRGVKLTPHPLLVLWSWKSRAIPLLTLWVVRPVQSLSACTKLHCLVMPWGNSRIVGNSRCTLKTSCNWTCTSSNWQCVPFPIDMRYQWNFKFTIHVSTNNSYWRLLHSYSSSLCRMSETLVYNDREDYYWESLRRFVWSLHSIEEYKKFLTIKPTRCTNFSNLFLEWNSTCFGQFLFPSAGDFHCRHSNSICHTVLLTACEHFQDGSVFHPGPALKLSANLYDVYHYCVYSEKLLILDRETVQTCSVSFQK
jgi:hypothetical protein